MAGEINFGALQTPDFMAEALKGQAAGRQQASFNALRGYQTDPAGTISALIGNGDITSASALANLQYQQQQRDLLAQGAKAFFHVGGTPQASPSPTAPPATASTPPAATPTPDPDAIAQAGQRLERVDTTTQLLQSIPYGPERKAALAQAAPNLAQLGLDPAKVAAFDPTDQNLDGIRQQIAQAHAQIGTTPGAGVAPAAPDQGAPAPVAAPSPADASSNPSAPSATPTAGMNIYDPATQNALGLMTLGSPQIGGALTALGAAVAPKFGGGERPGSAIIDQHTGKIVGFAPNTDGMQIHVDGQGNIIGVTKVPGYQDAEVGYQGALAGAKTHGEKAAAAPYDVQEYSLGPGKGTVKLTLDQFKALKASGQMPSLGQTQSPGAETNQKADAENFAKEVDAHGGPAIMGLQNARTVTEQAIHLAQNLNPNAGTELTGHIVGAINAATGGNIGAKQANDIATYQALLPQVMRGTFTTFPRLDKEFHIISQASASVNTPKDAATIILATQAAVQARNLAYAQFVDQYASGPGALPSKTALTHAFLQTPAAQASIFADPIWRGLKLGGQPAVQVGTTPYKDGHIYGVFMPHTPQAQTFLVR